MASNSISHDMGFNCKSSSQLIAVLSLLVGLCCKTCNDESSSPIDDITLKCIHVLCMYTCMQTCRYRSLPQVVNLRAMRVQTSH